MAFAGSHSRGEADETDYDENDRIGVSEVEVASTHFGQQKKHANGYDNDGAHEAADVATLAGATETIAHLCLISRRSLQRLAGDAVPLKPFKIVEQEQESNANQDDRTNGPLPAEIIERV